MSPPPTYDTTIASIADIVSQPETRLRKIMAALCADEEIHAKASALLDALERAEDSKEKDQVQVEGGADEVNCPSCESEGVNSRKRGLCAVDIEVVRGKGMVEERRVMNCAREGCGKEFNVGWNKGGCWYHDGNCDLNEHAKVWESMDIYDWTELNDDSYREDFPEGFDYDCCNGTADSKGCKERAHLVGDGVGDGEVKRVKY